MAAFYADEDFPGPVVAELRKLGHDVLTVREDGRADAGIEDLEILIRTIHLGRIILTKNRTDFHRLHSALPDHTGIVTIRDDRDRQALAARIDAAVLAQSTMAGKLIRINRPNPPKAP